MARMPHINRNMQLLSRSRQTNSRMLDSSLISRKRILALVTRAIMTPLAILVAMRLHGPIVQTSQVSMRPAMELTCHRQIKILMRYLLIPHLSGLGMTRVPSLPPFVNTITAHPLHRLILQTIGSLGLSPTRNFKDSSREFATIHLITRRSWSWRRSWLKRRPF